MATSSYSGEEQNKDYTGFNIWDTRNKVASRLITFLNAHIHTNHTKSIETHTGTYNILYTQHNRKSKQ